MFESGLGPAGPYPGGQGGWGRHSLLVPRWVGGGGVTRRDSLSPLLDPGGGDRRSAGVAGRACPEDRRPGAPQPPGPERPLGLQGGGGGGA